MQKRILFPVSFCLLLLLVLTSCGFHTSTTTISSNGQSQPHQIVLANCQQRPPSPSVTSSPPSAASHVIYLGSVGGLYAISASTGAILWCRQLKITGTFACPYSCPGPPFMLFGQPAIANDAVYVCASGYGGGYTYAFRAKNGVLLWRVKSDCAVVSMPYGDYAIPLVNQGIVYTGSYALGAQDGTILWKTALGVSFQELINGVIFANDEDSIYALNASNGKLRWRYSAPDHAVVGGRLVVDGDRVYYGTQDSVDGSEKSALYVLNAANGSLLWKFAMGSYSGATIMNGLVYVSSRDQYLYALDAATGAIRWRIRSVYPVYSTAVGTKGMLYINMDGVYALNAATGSVTWHQTLGAHQSDVYTPSTIVGDVVYLASTDGHGNSIVCALNAHDGTVYWQSGVLNQVTPLTVV